MGYRVVCYRRDGKKPDRLPFDWRYGDRQATLFRAMWKAHSLLYGKYTQSNVWHVHIVDEKTGQIAGIHTKGRGGVSSFVTDTGPMYIDRRGVHYGART